MRGHRRELVDDGAVAARVVGDRHDGDEVLAVRLDRERGALERSRAFRLVEIADAADEIGLGVRDRLLQRVTADPAHDDVGAAVGERREGHDLRLRPDRMRLGCRADLLARADEHDSEGPVVVHAAPHEQPVARLEDVQRKQHLGEQHGGQREERKQLRHRVNGTLRA